jgi:hypothetical protein
METITLPDVKIVKESSDSLLVIHNKTLMQTIISVKQLNSWAIAQLKKELVKQ